MSHGRTVWSCCGAVLSQCRCIGPHGPDSVAQGPCPACVGHRPVPYLTYPRPARSEPTPATTAAPGGEAVLLKFVEFVASVTCEDMHCEATTGMAKRALADYRRLREGK